MNQGAGRSRRVRRRSRSRENFDGHVTKVLRPFVARQEESTMADRAWERVIQRGYRGAWAAILLALPPAIAGCADHVQSSLATCPCSQGTTCCSSGVCAADDSACEQATSAL